MPFPPRSRVGASASAKKPKAAELAAAELRRQIVTGKLKPGDKLQPENVLQAEFEISRPTMREALRLLESESLISISRGKHGGATVRTIDLAAVSRQIGVYLQIESTTLADIWFARTVIEPPAASLLAEQRNQAALTQLEANIQEAHQAAKTDLNRYADLSAEFSLLITRNCGNNSLHLFAALIHDLIRRQHAHVTEITRDKTSVDKLRQESLRTREQAVALMRAGKSAQVERFWREHLQHMRDLVLIAYPDHITLDVLNKSTRKSPSVANVRRTLKAPRA
jgi:DNA-binding FadR family transcriptional regulator